MKSVSWRRARAPAPEAGVSSRNDSVASSPGFDVGRVRGTRQEGDAAGRNGVTPEPPEIVR
jgi:hypothetical protein